MAQAVTLMMASRGCSIFGSGTVSQRMSRLPCQQSAFMACSLQGCRLAPVWLATQFERILLVTSLLRSVHKWDTN